MQRFFYHSARTLRRTGSSIVRSMCTVTFTRIIGIMASGLPGSGTRVAGINGVESSILSLSGLEKQFYMDPKSLNSFTKLMRDAIALLVGRGEIKVPRKRRRLSQTDWQTKK